MNKLIILSMLSLSYCSSTNTKESVETNRFIRQTCKLTPDDLLPSVFVIVNQNSGKTYVLKCTK